MVHDGAVSGAVDGDSGHRRVATRRGVVEPLRRPAEIAFAFFTDGQDEFDWPLQSRAHRWLLEYAREYRHRHQSASVVTDAGAVRASALLAHRQRLVGVEDRVEVRETDQRLALDASAREAPSLSPTSQWKM